MRPVLALDLGGTRIKIGVALRGQLLAETAIDSHSDAGLRPRLPAIEAAARNLLSALPHGAQSFDGVGISSPGLIDVANARVIAINDKFTDAPSIDLRAWARDRFGAPLAIENDARMAVLGEQRFGGGRGCADLIMLTLGTGIGCGVICGGRLFRGAHDRGGILGGHMCLDIAADRCNCGNVGCAESLAAGWSLPRVARKFGIDDPSIDYRDVLPATDPKLAQLRAHSIRVWGMLVVNLIHLFDPSRIIIGGGIAAAHPQVIPDIEHLARQYVWAPRWETQIVPAQLGNSAALLACEPLVRDLINSNHAQT